MKTSATRLTPLLYNDPGLITDLGVGLWAWPLPMDYNGDGLMDLVLVCPGVPSNGIWFFENSGHLDEATGLPLFKKGVRRGDAVDSARISYRPDRPPLITSPGKVYPDFIASGFTRPEAIPATPPNRIHDQPGLIRANQWTYVDFEGRGILDLMVGIDYWGDYGWGGAHDEQGCWKNGPLHGYVYRLRNQGTNDAPNYAPPEKLLAGGKPVDVYGMPSPCFADFRQCGQFDLICGEFLDGFTWFENTGTREAPDYAAGRRLVDEERRPIKMDLCMTTPVACDFNGDGRVDLIVGDEDGRVAFIENTGRSRDGMPVFRQPRYFRQEADRVKFGVLSTPVAFDWDGNGRPDILAGNSAGNIGFIRNLGGAPTRWAQPVLLESSEGPIRIMAGERSSIQGPAEAKWGYTNIGVGDWDGDGLPDIVVNSIEGRIVWYKNIGTRQHPRLDGPRPVEVAWDGPPLKPAWTWWTPQPSELTVQWRCTPCVIDLDNDGINDLVTIDHEGFLAFYQQIERDGKRVLLPGRRIFKMRGPSVYNCDHQPQVSTDPTGEGLLQLNCELSFRSGRRTFCFVDWNGDGRLDLLVNAVPNVNLLRNVSETPGEWIFVDEGPVDSQVIANHNTAPAILPGSGPSGRPELLIGAEDGLFYLLSDAS